MTKKLFLLIIISYSKLIFASQKINNEICFDRNLQNAAYFENIKYPDIVKHREDLLNNINNRNSEVTIPKISHHIWLTDPNNPKEITNKDLNYIKKTLKFTSQNKSWSHIFWTNDPNLIPNTIKKLSEYNIIVKIINEKNIKKFPDIKDIYLKAFNYNFAMPSDIISYVILEEFGGVYFDTDYELYKIIDDLLEKYSFIAHEEPRNPYIGNAIIGASPNHPIIQEIIRLVKRNFSDQAPKYVRLACHDRAFTISASGPISFSIAFFNKANNDRKFNDIFMTDNTRLYKKIPIKHKLIGAHHGSNNWKKSNELENYPYCKECIREFRK